MKKLILISALLFSFNGWAQVSDDEIDNLLLTAETDYFNLPFFNSDQSNGKPKKDPFETEDEYQLRLEQWVPKTPKNINFILSKGVSTSEYNADNESWDHKIRNLKSVGYFSRNYEESTYIGSNAFGAEREILKRTGDTGKFSLINIPEGTVISIPMERDLARDIYADLEFIYVIEVNPDKSFFSSSWRRTYPEIDFRFDTAMTDYNVRAVLKAIVLKNTKTNEIVNYKNIADPSSSQAISDICLSKQEIIPYKEPKKKRRGRTGSMTQKVAKKLGEAQELIDDEKLDEGVAILNEILGFKKLSPYERGQVNYFFAYVRYLKNDFEGAIVYYKKVAEDPNVPDGLIESSKFTIAQLYFQLEEYQTVIKQVDQMMFEVSEESNYTQLYNLKAAAAFWLKDYCTTSFIANYLLDNFDLGESKEPLVKLQEAAEFDLRNSFSTF